MPKLRNLSSHELVKILENYFSCKMVRQKGSHQILVCVSPGGEHINAVIPNHKEVSVGVILKTYKNLIKIYPEEKVIKYFYTE